MKPKIIHFIDYFSKGGAEVLLAGLVPYLEEYDNYVFYLKPTSNPLTNLLPEAIHVECFNHTSLKTLLPVLLKIKQRFKEIRPDIIHTHLMFSTLFTKVLLPKNTPLITTYHSTYYRVWYPKTLSRIKRSILQMIDTLTYKSHHTILHVSNYQQSINDKDVRINSSTVLYNYAEDIYFNNSKPVPILAGYETLRIIAVGNLKMEKNYYVLLQAIKKLKHLPILVDIYGEGHERAVLQQYIDKHHLPVTLKSQSNCINELLPDYHLFVQASKIEGFGISVVEAMAVGLPVLLSDIGTFKEITDNQAIFFENNNAENLAKKIEELYQNPDLMRISAKNCKTIALRYRKDQYLNTIRSIYSNHLKK